MQPWTTTALRRMHRSQMAVVTITFGDQIIANRGIRTHGATRDARRARRVLRRSNVHEENLPHRSASTPARRRSSSRAAAQSGGELDGGRGLARELSVRAWATYASRSRSVHFPTISRMVSGRAKRPASYGAGYERARRTAPGKMMSNVQPASRGQPRSPSDVVERVWWAARNLGVRSRRRRQLGGRAAHRERRGQPPNSAGTSTSM